ncbi:hypothetical protein HBH56_158490 [Parastagonospora nodorum]|nr:hypothetical protein HBH56_158490 [Parastagonospora nodorum]KAH3922494.1 hypothetical protein HBH54_222920 [Parastagonospora nodorum]KAH4018017.1 hypothetical protein HBI13_138160 [Parastagonospora nodorum]KAH4036256.1 hypothetical protein HBI09_084740 [Parastagonospora nodorum]KAH4050441.1 hypothetical protein HBH49_132570 [Parastagonospora nodorum]
MRMKTLAAKRLATIQAAIRNIPLERCVQEADERKREVRVCGQPAVQKAKVAEDDFVGVDERQSRDEVQGPLVY